MTGAEIIAFFTALKALGVDTVLILSLIVISLFGALVAVIASWKLVNFFTKGFKESVDSAKMALAELTLLVKNLNLTLTSHIERTDKQMLEGEKRFEGIDEEIKKIKAHVGLK